MPPTRLMILGGRGVSHAPWQSPDRGARVRVCPARGWGSSRAASPPGEVTFGPFSLFFPPLPTFPLVPGRRFLVSLLCSCLCVCWQSRWQCWPGREAPLSPGSSSQAPSHTGEGTRGHQPGAPEHPAPPSWCWAPTCGFPAPRRSGAMPCSPAPWQGDAVRRGTEQGCKFFSWRRALAGCSTHRTVSPGPTAVGCAAGRSLQGSRRPR